MTSRDIVRRALTFQNPPRAPRNLWKLGDSEFRADDAEAIDAAFPSDFHAPMYTPGRSRRARGLVGHTGTYVDEWGCVWHVAERAVVGEVKEPPLADWSALDTYEMPWEVLREADYSTVNADCARTERFCLSGTSIRPFERMQFLRGTENLFVDLAYGTREVYRLRDMLHDYYMDELSRVVATDTEAVSFMDDWGTQRALLIHPDMWRSFFKPLYKDYCDLIHGRGKFVFFHSDGFIEAIYPDLIEIGVDAVNSQLFCMDIESIAARYKGRITFHGEIDRQWILPYGTVDEVRAAVRRVRGALDDGTGGVIAQCEMGIPDPRANILAVFDEWNKPLAECLAGK